MAPKFGTSGLRGLVVELTEPLIADHLRGFFAACDTGTGIFVGRDLRPSSPEIAEIVLKVAQEAGLASFDCGAVPTPALALAAREAGAAAVMVTGSHIPADRNGLKFYTPKGEITKADETAILAGLRQPARIASERIETVIRHDVSAAFVARYTNAFGATALRGKRIGVYSHSAVGRDDLIAVLRGLGAQVIELGRSAHFIPVDTEAVDPEVARQIKDWVRSEALDAVASSDGDSDRPLLADEQGNIIPGDLLGQICAQYLKAEQIVTPISSNSGVLQKGAQVTRTKIGSPFVIAAMEEAGGKVVGYEANGGFLLGFDADTGQGVLAALPTRDCILPIVLPLIAAGTGPLSDRVLAEPKVVTLSARLQEIPTEHSAAFLQRLTLSPAERQAFLDPLRVAEAGLDLTDGLRILLQGGGVLHLRPSGNAPEFRVYVEGASRALAEELQNAALQAIAARLIA